MRLHSLLAVCAASLVARAQLPPYHQPPPVEPPLRRIRYEGSEKPGELLYPATFTLWIPAGVATLRGVVVHQHGCGEGSCLSGQTGAMDLHWQALARRHGCALLSPSYEQPDKADCQKWCDPRNGSDAAFLRALNDLGALTGHPELARVPWAIWGHSGGGHWAGGMLLLHPERIAAVWCRSGVPPITAEPGRPAPFAISDAALGVPVMANLGTQEGFSVTDGRFAGVWKKSDAFVRALRARGGLAGISIDPVSSHDCGNQRYLAIPWLDACLSARLPVASGPPLVPMEVKAGWLVPMAAEAGWLAPFPQPGVPTGIPVAFAAFAGDRTQALWLPGESVSRAWAAYMKDTAVPDTTPPPAPRNLRVDGQELTWECDADLESGLAGFIVLRDGREIARLPREPKNPFGRPVFQNLQYSDTAGVPLVPMRYRDETAEPGKTPVYQIRAVNTVGLVSGE